MPRPNSPSESFPTLRLHRKQDLDSSLLSSSKPYSMPSQSLSYSPSFRRFNSRRFRPCAASIADLFVSSLVMAGFCHEHSPGGRGLSTMSIAAARDNLTKWRRRDTTNEMHVHSRKRLRSLGSRTEYVGLRSPRAQRMLSTGTLQKLDDGCSDKGGGNEVDSKDSLEEADDEEEPSSGRRKEEDTNLGFEEESDSELEISYSEELGKSTVHDFSFPSAEKGDAEEFIGEASLDGRLQPACSSRYRTTSPTKETYYSTFNLYRGAIGEKMGWKDALGTVAADNNDWPKPVPVARQRKNKSRDATELPAVKNLITALFDEKKRSNHYIFRLYRDIPSPGVALLAKHSRGVLLRRFGRPLYRRRPDARRLLALLEDMVAADIPASRSSWTSAIHLSGRASGIVTKMDLERAIGVWRQMEYIAGIKADGITFNVLFDIAIRSGQHTVAQRLLEEAKSRGISLPRFGKVSKIYYQGVLGDADGVHKAFDDFVESGEIVDTVVLNCVIRSLIRAGDVQEAVLLYKSMMDAQKALRSGSVAGKQYMSHYPTLSPEFTVYRTKSKKLGRLLQYSASLQGKMPEHHIALQKALPLTPDQRTFHIILSCHAERTGSLKGFMSTLRDFECASTMPSRSIVYLLLFEGFARFGGENKEWSAKRLHKAWRACLRAIYGSMRIYHERSHHRQTKLEWENPLEPSVNQSGSDSAKADMEEMEMDELFNNSDAQQLNSELYWLEKRVENGLFLGIRLIFVVLRAFGTCCSEQELIEVWLKIERIWQPNKRRIPDVLAVKEELQRQLARTRRRPWK